MWLSTKGSLSSPSCGNIILIKLTEPAAQTCFAGVAADKGLAALSLLNRLPEGCLTILLGAVQMQRAYDEYNEHTESIHRGSHGHFMVDLCRPSHLTACLRAFQSALHANDDNWDAQFGELPCNAEPSICMIQYFSADNTEMAGRRHAICCSLTNQQAAIEAKHTMMPCTADYAAQAA